MLSTDKSTNMLSGKARLPPPANGSLPPPKAQLSEEDRHICLDIFSVIVHGGDATKKGTENKKIKKHEDVYEAARRVLRFRKLPEDETAIKTAVTNVNLHPELGTMIHENQVYGDAKKRNSKTAEEHGKEIQKLWTQDLLILKKRQGSI